MVGWFTSYIEIGILKEIITTLLNWTIMKGNICS